jgi:hypothetical protein
VMSRSDESPVMSLSDVRNDARIDGRNDSSVGSSEGTQ